MHDVAQKYAESAVKSHPTKSYATSEEQSCLTGKPYRKQHLYASQVVR